MTEFPGDIAWWLKEQATELEQLAWNCGSDSN